MKKIFLLVFVLFTYFIQAQEVDKMSLSPCGTPPQYQQTNFHDIDFQRGIDDTILYVPMTLHQMGNDNGGFFSTIKLLDAFNQLNSNYVPSYIHWFIEGDIKFVKSSFWNNHKTVIEGWDMMSKNNVKNTLNCYVCTNAAGNCGYNTPYGGVALARGCTGASDHTWAHELGHALRLPHPFLGWEGKTYDPNKPTPTKVTYDYTLFKDSIILNQTIIDTALVEMVNKSNCAEAADKICDTKPDYISQRWVCNSSKLSSNTFKDPNGDSFQVDGSLYMSYADDACQTRFSDDEIKIMRQTLRTKKKNLLYNQTPGKPLPNKATTLLLPLEKAKVAPENVLLQWEKIDNATLYVVEVSRIITFSSIDYEYITDKTEVTVPSLIDNRTYYWRARAFNSHYGGITSAKGSFFTGAYLSEKNIQSIENAVLFPNPSSASQVLLQMNLNSELKGQVHLCDFTGKSIFTQKILLSNGNQQLIIPTENISKGIYFVVISDEKGGIMTKKLIKE